MKSFLTIVAASAILSASLVAGLAASDPTQSAASAALVRTDTAESGPKAVAVEAPVKADTACRDAAWPYRPVMCAEPMGAAPRKVRIIAANGSAMPAVPAVR